jgi:hypothetical protein
MRLDEVVISSSTLSSSLAFLSYFEGQVRSRPVARIEVTRVYAAWNKEDAIRESSWFPN